MRCLYYRTVVQRPMTAGELSDGERYRLRLALAIVSLGQTVSFIVALNDGSIEIEHQPHLRSIAFQVPGPDFPAHSWTA